MGGYPHSYERPSEITFLATSASSPRILPCPNDATQEPLPSSNDGRPLEQIVVGGFRLSHVWDYRENCHCDRIWDDSIFNPNDPASPGHTVVVSDENNIAFRDAPRPSSPFVQLMEGPHGSRYGFRYEHKATALAEVQRLYFSPTWSLSDVRVIAAHLTDVGDRRCWAFPKNPSITTELCRSHLKCHPNYVTKAVALRRAEKEVRALQLAAAKKEPVWEQHMNCRCSESGKIVESDDQLTPSATSPGENFARVTKIALGPSWEAFGEFFTGVLKTTASNIVVVKREGRREWSRGGDGGWVAWLQAPDLKVEECSRFLRCKPDLGVTVVLRRDLDA